MSQVTLNAVVWSFVVPYLCADPLDPATDAFSVDGQDTMAALMRVHSTLHELVGPYLYRHPVVVDTQRFNVVGPQPPPSTTHCASSTSITSPTRRSLPSKASLLARTRSLRLRFPLVRTPPSNHKPVPALFDHPMPHLRTLSFGPYWPPDKPEAHHISHAQALATLAAFPIAHFCSRSGPDWYHGSGASPHLQSVTQHLDATRPQAQVFHSRKVLRRTYGAQEALALGSEEHLLSIHQEILHAFGRRYRHPTTAEDYRLELYVLARPRGDKPVEQVESELARLRDWVVTTAARFTKIDMKGRILIDYADVAPPCPACGK